MIGQTFGELLALDLGERGPHRHQKIRCICLVEGCGEIVEIRRSDLLAGKTRSCGKHFRANGLSGSRAHRAWRDMHSRVRNDASYRSWGVCVDPRWDLFENFHEDMGDPPEDLVDPVLHRTNGGDYGPGRCEWVSELEHRRLHGDDYRKRRRPPRGRRVRWTNAVLDELVASALKRDRS